MIITVDDLYLLYEKQHFNRYAPKYVVQTSAPVVRSIPYGQPCQNYHKLYLKIIESEQKTSCNPIGNRQPGKGILQVPDTGTSQYW